MTKTGTAGAPAHHDTIGEALARLIGLGKALRALFRAWRSRQEMLRLGQFDDRMLKDIGVQRSDVDWALMQPWNVDPTLMLAERVRRRRASEFWLRRLQHRVGNQARAGAPQPLKTAGADAYHG